MFRFQDVRGLRVQGEGRDNLKRGGSNGKILFCNAPGGHAGGSYPTP